VQRAGVCRDFAHLGITLCRALNIPARLVVGYVYFDEPPQDFHAVFEAWLDGRWVLFDATRMAPIDRLVRIGTGTEIEALKQELRWSEVYYHLAQGLGKV
jgi:transglutaminase-like putative cysteine protease